MEIIGTDPVDTQAKKTAHIHAELHTKLPNALTDLNYISSI